MHRGSRRNASGLPLASTLDWRRFIVAIWRFRWLVLLVAILGSASGFAMARQIRPKYRAEATIWIAASNPRGHDQEPLQTSELLQAGAWADLLKSYRVLDEVVDDLRLYLTAGSPEEADLLTHFPLESGLVTGHYRLVLSPDGRLFELWAAGDRLVQQGMIGDSTGLLSGLSQETLSRVAALGRDIEFSVESRRDVARGLGERINTKVDAEHTFLSLSLTGEDPLLISRVLNAVSQRYVEVISELKRAKLVESTRILDEQLWQANQQLRESETELEAFRVRTVTLPQEAASPVAPGLGATREASFSNYAGLLMEREQLRRDRWSIDRVLRNASESGPSIEGLEIIPAVRGSSDLVLAMGELAAKRAELRAVLNRYTEEHKVVRDLRREIQSLEQVAVPRLALDLARTLADRELILESLIEAAADELRQTPMRAIGEARLERRVGIAATLYNTLQARRDEARLAAESSIPDVRIMDAALPPQMPINESQEEQLILLVLMASLSIAVAAGILLDLFDTRLTYPQQVSDGLGVPVVGSVPHISDGSRGLNSIKAAKVVEAFRVIRLNVSHAHGTAGPMVVAITSPEPEDGKSFVVANLAMAFSGMGHRTLVIDADVRRGSQHRLLGGARKPGLADYLAGHSSIQEVVQDTTHKSLSRIASGTRRQDGPELLQSRAMSVLLAQMRKNFDVILVDTPPLAACADPLALGTITGNMVLVVRTGTTDRSLTEWRLDALDRLPIRLLGAILNDVPHGGIYRYHRKRYATLYAPDGAKRALPGKRIQISVDLREGASKGSGEADTQVSSPEETPNRLKPVSPSDTEVDSQQGDQVPGSGASGNGKRLPLRLPLAADGQIRIEAPQYGRLDELLNLEVEPVERGMEVVQIVAGDAGAGNGNGNGNGDERHGRALNDDNDDTADSRIEAFRQHQRRSHVRLWK
jgi:capsular exopolysaccharide synthesis family protein